MPAALGQKYRKYRLRLGCVQEGKADAPVCSRDASTRDTDAFLESADLNKLRSPSTDPSCLGVWP